MLISKTTCCDGHAVAGADKCEERPPCTERDYYQNQAPCTNNQVRARPARALCASTSHISFSEHKHRVTRILFNDCILAQQFMHII